MFSSCLPEKPCSALSILIADDVVELAQMVQLWLRESGHAVTVVTCGNDAIRLLRVRRFDLIITDIIMPDGDGLEVIDAARRAHPRPRLVAMSGGGQHLAASDCLKLARNLGADATLRKPFQRQQLLAAVGQAIARSAEPA